VNNKKLIEQVLLARYPGAKIKQISEAKKAKPDYLDIDKDGNKKEPMKKAVKDKQGKLKEASKPDYLDVDGDGNKKEPMKKALKDKKKEMHESESASNDDRAKAEVFNKIVKALKKSGKSNDELMDSIGICLGCISHWLKDAKKKHSENLNELSKDTLKSYAKKAAVSALTKGVSGGASVASSNEKDRASGERALQKAANRTKGIQRAVDKLEEAETNPKYTGRETKDGVWHVFKSGKASSESGPFKSAAECRKWIKQHEDKKLDEAEVTEKAKSKAQQKFFGVVRAAQKGEGKATGKAGEAAKSMSKKDVKDFASTKHKGLPEKVKKTDENASCGASGAGAVATTNLPMLGDKKITEKQVGNGVYESLLRGHRNDMLPTAKKQLNESISITVDDEDAESLLQLLAMAGIQQQPSAAVVVSDEESLDENSPDWPNRPETFSDTPTLSAYSGGLNAPKTTTGQSTTPILASQKNRQHTYEDVDLERTLFKLYQQYKGE
jgi:hypothetical protein